MHEPYRLASGIDKGLDRRLMDLANNSSKRRHRNQRLWNLRPDIVLVILIDIVGGSLVSLQKLFEARPWAKQVGLALLEPA